MESSEINLISDTVTKPTPGMMQAMMSAEVGDDVFGQDPTVKKLEQKLANYFGHEAGLFCPSGTMTNQIAIKAQTQPLDEILLDELAHIYRYELGGYGFHSGVAIHVMRGDRGIVSNDMIRSAVKPKADWNPTTRMLCLENSINMGGGNYYTLSQIQSLTNTAREYALRTHLDGARIFNVLVETGDDPEIYGLCFDSISVCLSKGLGAPVGSVLISDEETIAMARRIRKVMGGGMRQSGILAAAGIYALDHHVELLKIDHEHARTAAALLEKIPWVKSVIPPKTNIVIFEVADGSTAAEKVSLMAKHGILCTAINNTWIRFVFHLDITPDRMTRFIETAQTWQA